MVDVSVSDTDDSESAGASPEKESPGKILLQARLHAGLTQEQVAKELYMTVYKVKALESDDYTRLSSDTFARGYIRAYANLVKVDVVVILAAYDALIERLKPKEIVHKQQVHTATPNSPRGAWQFLAVIGAFFIGLWLISVWFFDNHSDEQYAVTLVASSSAASVKMEVANSNSSLASTEAITSDSLVAASASIASNASSASSAAVLNTQVIASVAVSSEGSTSASSSSSKKTSLDELSFSFREESWLEVSDSRGDVLATELQPAGSKLNVIGLAPFDVKLGNAPAVDIALNGKKMDVIPLLGSNVLTLKIGN